MEAKFKLKFVEIFSLFGYNLDMAAQIANGIMRITQVKDIYK